MEENKNLGGKMTNEEYLDNEKLTDIMRCAACLQVPIYPRECRHCTKIVCDTCLTKHERNKKNADVCFHCKSQDPNAFGPIQSKVL